jgi:recombination protein RecT
MSAALAERRDNPDETGETLSMAINKQRGEIDRALGRIAGQDPDRFIRVVLTLVKSTPKLAECTPSSILGGMMQAAQLGLEFGSMGHAYLVPFWNTDRRVMEAQFIPGYKGLIDLHLRSGKVASIVARPIYEKDVFEYWDDEEGDHYKRVPFLGNDRGEIVRYYGRAKLVNGDSILHVMELDDVERIKKKSKSKNRNGQIVGPWVTDDVMMSCKTVVRQFSRWLPQSVEVATALDADEEVIRLRGSDLIVDRGDALTAPPPGELNAGYGGTEDPPDGSETGGDGDPGPIDPESGSDEGSDEGTEATGGTGALVGDLAERLLAYVQGLSEKDVAATLRQWSVTPTGNAKALSTKLLQVFTEALQSPDPAVRGAVEALL